MRNPGEVSPIFSPDYFTARQRFREAATVAGARLFQLRLDAKGPAGEDLTIDVSWIGTETPRRVLLHSSGLHGVEGFAGSAIQLRLLSRPPRLQGDEALVLAHILNPYGMAWLRRVNENNVDLNRNCVPTGEYAGAPPAYSKLNSVLNPQSSPEKDFFFLKAAFLVLRYGMPFLKQAVVGGQYEYPKGLFFGGRVKQQGIEMYETFIRERLRAIEKLTVIDVHTGLGSYGQDTLLVDPKDHPRLRAIFGERVRPLEAAEGTYQVRGGLPWVFASLPSTEITFIGQEFGTYNPIRVLHALREENRWHQYGSGALEHDSKRTIKEMFCPGDGTWRTRVLERGSDLLIKAMDYGMLCATGS